MFRVRFVCEECRRRLHQRRRRRRCCCCYSWARISDNKAEAARRRETRENVEKRRRRQQQWKRRREKRRLRDTFYIASSVAPRCSSSSSIGQTFQAHFEPDIWRVPTLFLRNNNSKQVGTYLSFPSKCFDCKKCLHLNVWIAYRSK